ncbi:bifunctional diguanylate cyclase/phosphohydrolase [Desulfotomaculum copahuensis]|uniref:Diguanylate cyclase n=1 Tax=Desulfotomaculum copahuensis TaxID=1838280 RepID=A0A1B7LKI9_9FIRM|nr:diguanylate cyclase [Desulfotomaculum copahuensis]OAT87053.1 hypothetical protein A6M21_01785 [Desulfotomaculum copahuensis]
MRDWKEKRKKDFFEHVNVLHSAGILIFILALISAYNIKLLDFNNALSQVGFVSIIILAGMLIYLGYKIYYNLDIDRLPNAAEVLLVIALIPASITLAYLANGQFGVKMVLLIPVLIASSAWGKEFGLGVATLACMALFYVDLSNPVIKNFQFVFEQDLVNTGVIMLTAWYVGGMTNVERDTREALIEMANVDGLTDLYNHRCFQDKLLLSLSEAKGNHSRLSLIMMDIDYFKHYNDLFGHQAGDQVLITIGGILKNLVKPPFYAARYGGEEFVVVMPGADLEAAAALDAEIKKAVAETPLKGMEFQPGGRLTISSGIAGYPWHDHTPWGLIKAADDALYQAKYGRRNKLHFYFSVVDELRSLSSSETELINFLKPLLAIINVRDRYTYGHSERVTVYATALAGKLNLPPDEVELIRHSAQLHDIGKIEIDTEILNKPGKLTGEEWEIIKKHPVWGSEILRPLTSLTGVMPVIRHHHENLDGTGYPDGLAGEDIPRGARILRIVDSFDAITTNRPYKKRLNEEEACREMQRGAGRLYDQDMLDTFIQMVRKKELPAVIRQPDIVPES